MCSTCGCGNTEELLIDGKTAIAKDHHHEEFQSKVVSLEKDILSKNDHQAHHNREHFDSHGLISFNLVSSPGSGKTTILEKTLQELGRENNCYVIEGDQQTDLDAERIKATGTSVVQINTGKACHLDAEMIHKAFHRFEKIDPGFLFIENVGNLVCPALFDLGEHSRVVIMSVTEGEDKPLKYPDMFSSADVCLINKIDLLPYLKFDMDIAMRNVLRTNSKMKFFEVSAESGEGLDNWIASLKDKISEPIT